MRTLATLTAAALIAVTAPPVLANPGHSNGCPPGLAKKSPACVPPGQAKKRWNRGDHLRIEDYRRIADPRRYDLQARPDWDYYRDGNRVYRVDRDTRRILAILNLIDAFSN